MRVRKAWSLGIPGTSRAKHTRRGSWRTTPDADEAVSVTGREGQHASFGGIDQALLDKFVARDRQVADA